MSADRGNQESGLGWMRRGRLQEAQEEQSDTSIPRSEPAPPSPATTRKKTGKRSNPEWEAVSAFMKKDTYRRVRRALLMQEAKMDFSDLIEDLCQEWLKEAED